MLNSEFLQRARSYERALFYFDSMSWHADIYCHGQQKEKGHSEIRKRVIYTSVAK
jgi:hypothetical protein